MSTPPVVVASKRPTVTATGRQQVRSSKVVSKPAGPPAAPAPAPAPARSPSPHSSSSSSSSSSARGVMSDDPDLTPEQRVARMRERRRRRQEKEQLGRLRAQGVAPRPQTLIRSRHGQLRALTDGRQRPPQQQQQHRQIQDAPTQLGDAPQTDKPEPVTGGGGCVSGTSAVDSTPPGSSQTSARVSQETQNAKPVNLPSVPPENKLEIDLDDDDDDDDS